MNLAEKRYDKKKMDLAIFGLSIAIIASIANATFPIFSGAEIDIINSELGVGDRLAGMFAVTMI